MFSQYFHLEVQSQQDLELFPFFHTSQNSFLPHLLHLVNGTPALVTKTGPSQPSCLALFFALQIPSYTLGSSADTTHQPSALSQDPASLGLSARGHILVT